MFISQRREEVEVISLISREAERQRQREREAERERERQREEC
jgi:hypothetical protein